MPARTHSNQPSAGTRQRRRANDGAKAGEVATVSARALIMRAPPRRSVAQGGTRPQRAVSSTRAVAALRHPDQRHRVGGRDVPARRQPLGDVDRVEEQAEVGLAPRRRVPPAHGANGTPAAAIPGDGNAPPDTVVPGRQNGGRDRSKPAPGSPRPRPAPSPATVRLPGSKSMTARALVLSALADGPSVIEPPAARPRHRADGRRPARARRRASTPTDDERWPVEPGPAARPGPGRRGPGRHDHAVPAAGRRARRRHGRPSTATRTPATGRCARSSRRCAPSACGSTRRRPAACR